MVVVIGEGFDFLGQISDASERASPNRALRDDVEPDLDLVEPRRVRWRVVDVKARSGREPTSNALVLVGRVVVYDEMNVQLLRDGRFDVTKGGGHVLRGRSRRAPSVAAARASCASAREPRWRS